MRIHTLEDKSFDLDILPDEWGDLPDYVFDTRFAILDNSDTANPDFRFVPLVFLSEITSPAVVLKIGEYKIKMPLEWSVVIGEEDLGDLESLELTALNDRPINVFQFNSLSAFMPTFEPIEIIDVYNEVNCFAPKLKNGQFMAIPLETGSKPKCVYFTDDISRNCEVIDYNKLW